MSRIQEVKDTALSILAIVVFTWLFWWTWKDTKNLPKSEGFVFEFDPVTNEKRR